MCFNLFKPKPPVTPPPVVTPPVTPAPLTIPHPEEPMNPNATAANTSIRGVLAEWMEIWEVPLASQPYFYNVIGIYVVDDFPDWLKALLKDPDGTPACKLNDPITGQVEIYSKAPWWNKGVAAHEVGGHPAYSQLTDDEKLEFESTYVSLLQEDPLMELLWSVDSYEHTSAVEAHAEIYRYLGQFMPESLKKFYRGLF